MTGPGYLGQSGRADWPLRPSAQGTDLAFPTLANLQLQPLLPCVRKLKFRSGKDPRIRFGKIDRHRGSMKHEKAWHGVGYFAYTIYLVMSLYN